MTPNGWKELVLAEAVEVNPKRTLTKGALAPFVEMAAVRVDLPQVEYVAEREYSGSGARFQNGDTLFARITPCAENGKTAFVDCLPQGVAAHGSTEFIVLAPREGVTDGKFLYFLTKSDFVRPYAISQMEGTSGRQRVPARIFEEIVVPIPPIDEQSKIATVLSSVDDAIQSTQAVVEQTQVLMTGLLQNLLSRGINHGQFKQTELGTLPTSWEVKPVGDLVDRIRTPVAVQADATYSEIGIRSHGKGVFLKPPVLGAALGEKSVFQVEPGCLVLNIVFAWEGAVAVTDDTHVGMVASHRFPMYQPNTQVDLRWLKLFFTSAKGVQALGLASPGGAGRNRTLNQRHFAELKVPVPPLEEQRQICSTIENVERTLCQQQEQLDSLIATKVGLMHDLLSGKVRV